MVHGDRRGLQLEVDLQLGRAVAGDRRFIDLQRIVIIQLVIRCGDAVRVVRRLVARINDGHFRAGRCRTGRIRSRCIRRVAAVRILIVVLDRIIHRDRLPLRIEVDGRAVHIGQVADCCLIIVDHSAVFARSPSREGIARHTEGICRQRCVRVIRDVGHIRHAAFQRDRSCRFISDEFDVVLDRLVLDVNLDVGVLHREGVAVLQRYRIPIRGMERELFGNGLHLVSRHRGVYGNRIAHFRVAGGRAVVIFCMRKRSAANRQHNAVARILLEIRAVVVRRDVDMVFLFNLDKVVRRRVRDQVIPCTVTLRTEVQRRAFARVVSIHIIVVIHALRKPAVAAAVGSGDLAVYNADDLELRTGFEIDTERVLQFITAVLCQLIRTVNAPISEFTDDIVLDRFPVRVKDTRTGAALYRVDVRNRVGAEIVVDAGAVRLGVPADELPLIGFPIDRLARNVARIGERTVRCRRLICGLIRCGRVLIVQIELHERLPDRVQVVVRIVLVRRDLRCDRAVIAVCVILAVRLVVIKEVRRVIRYGERRADVLLRRACIHLVPTAENVTVAGQRARNVDRLVDRERVNAVTVLFTVFTNEINAVAEPVDERRVLNLLVIDRDEPDDKLRVFAAGFFLCVVQIDRERLSRHDLNAGIDPCAVLPLLDLPALEDDAVLRDGFTVDHKRSRHGGRTRLRISNRLVLIGPAGGIGRAAAGEGAVARIVNKRYAVRIVVHLDPSCGDDDLTDDVVSADVRPGIAGNGVGAATLSVGRVRISQIRNAVVDADAEIERIAVLIVPADELIAFCLRVLDGAGADRFVVVHAECACLRAARESDRRAFRCVHVQYHAVALHGPLAVYRDVAVRHCFGIEIIRRIERRVRIPAVEVVALSRRAVLIGRRVEVVARHILAVVDVRIERVIVTVVRHPMQAVLIQLVVDVEVVGVNVVIGDGSGARNGMKIRAGGLVVSRIIT